MRKIWDIHGGVHPLENKSQSVQTAIKQASIAKELVLPLSQHIGSPAKPVVSIGDRVLKGQLIAEATGFVSVPVHASTSGEIIAIETRPIVHPSGMDAPCIVIKSDGKDEWTEHQGLSDYRHLEKPILIEHIRNCGIAGMGGAGFPSAVKLNTRDDQVIETLIINGTECEPYITSDDILMRERAEQVIGGVQILQHLIAPSKETLIGIEDNKPEAIAALNKFLADNNIKDIEVVSFPTKYPSGGEKQLIQILTGKEVASGGLPAAIGVVCQNIGTTTAIYRAVCFGEPLVSRITTVTGDAVKQQQNYEVALGTPMEHLLSLSGYEQSKASRLIMGGPMMGFTVETEQAPIVKTTNCILAPSVKELPPPPPAQACIRCGMCAEACPVSLLPQQLFWYAQAKDHERLQDHNLMDCIECGACSYACPSQIPLVQYYRASKADIRQAALDQKKSEQSKLRFEAREARLLAIEQEKEARRKARKKVVKPKAATPAAAKVEAASEATTDKTADVITANAATSPSAADDKSAIIQAAIERAQAKQAQTPANKLKTQISSLENRIKKAQEKLVAAERGGDDTVHILRSSVEKLQKKLSDAQIQLIEIKQGQAK